MLSTVVGIVIEAYKKSGNNSSNSSSNNNHKDDGSNNSKFALKKNSVFVMEGNDDDEHEVEARRWQAQALPPSWLDQACSTTLSSSSSSSSNSGSSGSGYNIALVEAVKYVAKLTPFLCVMVPFW